MDRTKRPLALPLVLAALLAGLAACAEPPAAEEQSADQALQAARDAEAETYAPESLRAADTALQEARTEIQTQNERFAIMRMRPTYSPWSTSKVSKSEALGFLWPATRRAL